MRRIALEQPDGSLYSWPDGKPVTFKTVSLAIRFVGPGERLKPIDVPDDHEDAQISGPH
jgi:hypothetical protein